MTDPLDALREPITPAAPRPDFAAWLREELERAVLQPQGAAMSSSTGTPASTATPANTARTMDTGSRAESVLDVRLSALTPYLAVDDSRQALAFYAEAFGAQQQGEPIVMPDGRIGHAQVVIGGAVLMFADEAADLGLLSPRTRGGVSQSVVLQVSDVDGTVDRAVRLGAELTRAVADYPHGRNGVVLDPFGHRWMISSAPAAEPGSASERAPASASTTATAGPGHGDLVYLTHGVPDVEAAKEFYAAVLGWRFSPGRVADGWQIEGTAPMAGLHGGQPAEIQPCYQVDDLRTALDAVRTSGGTAEHPTVQPYGRLASCTDNQGRHFSLLEPAR